jgi:predicted regulator of Ras-like GTPase activity (Roadblock/LC7/MglB family)
MATNLDQTLNEVMNIAGAKAAALVDWESGMTLGTVGSGINMDLAAAGNTNVVRAKQAVMKDLKIKGEIEDILITLSGQYHMIRLLEKDPNLFLYLVLDRATANLGLARHKLSALEADLTM